MACPGITSQAARTCVTRAGVQPAALAAVYAAFELTATGAFFWGLNEGSFWPDGSRARTPLLPSHKNPSVVTTPKQNQIITASLRKCIEPCLSVWGRALEELYAGQGCLGTVKIFSQKLQTTGAPLWARDADDWALEAESRACDECAARLSSQSELEPNPRRTQSGKARLPEPRRPLAQPRKATTVRAPTRRRTTPAPCCAPD